MSRHHISLKKSTRRTHASSRPWNIPSVSLIRRQRRRPEAYILQGEINKIKTLNFNGEQRKVEEVEAWILEMNKYF
jgi:hypothetical protein